MGSNIQSIRGMHDILPDQTAIWQYFEQTVRNTIQAYGYSEIRMPVLEPTDLFCRSIGEVTDIVEKEMYTFNDLKAPPVVFVPVFNTACYTISNNGSGIWDPCSGMNVRRKDVIGSFIRSVLKHLACRGRMLMLN